MRKLVTIPNPELRAMTVPVRPDKIPIIIIPAIISFSRSDICICLPECSEKAKN